MSSDDPGGEPTMPATAAGSDSQPDQPPLVRLTARPTLVQIVRPPVTEGDVVATFQRDHLSDATNGPNNASVHFILTNNSSSGKSKQNEAAAAAAFQCCHCEVTCDTEELLLDHLRCVHLEHKKDASSLQQVSGNLKSLAQVSNSDNASKRIKPAIISKPKKFPPDALYSLLADSAASLESPGTLTTTITLVKSPSHTSDDNTSYSNPSGKAAKNSAKADYVCQFLRCSKRFPKLDQLRQHHRGHFRLKPYQCTWPGCSQDFSRRPAALRHIRTMHQKMPRWKVGELTAEAKGEAHKFIRVVSEAVQEEESALDAVRRAKKRILVGQTTNTQSLSASSSSSAAAAKSAPISNKASATAAENDEENNDYESDIEEEEEEEEGSNIQGENPESTSADDQNADCQQTEKPRRSYLCQFPRCGKVYQRLYALRMHHRSHSKHQPYYCKFPKADHRQEEEEEGSPSSSAISSSECGEPFRRRANAVRHILAKHYGVPKADQSSLSGPEKARANAFIGEQAQVLAKEEASLESLRINRPRDPSRPPLKYRCQTCQKFFPAPGKLLVHQRTHSEALKPFFCRWAGCPKQAITERATLLKHILQKHIKAGGQQTFEKVQQAEELMVIDSDNKSATQTSFAAASTSAGAFTEAEKAAAAPYVGVHQHLLEQEKKTVLKRTEEVLPPAPDTMSTTTTNDNGALTGLRSSHTGEPPFNFQSLFSVPMSGPFPPVHFGPVFSVQIAVHKID